MSKDHGVAQSVRSLRRMRKVGCSNPSRDSPNSKTGSDGSTAKHSATVVSVTGSLRCPVSQLAWHAKEPLLLNGRVKVNILTTSLVMVS